MPADRQRHGRQRGQVGRHREDVRQVHLVRVRDLLAEAERRRRRGRREQHVDASAEDGVEVAAISVRTRCAVP
jgi:hypothetical protein